MELYASLQRVLYNIFCVSGQHRAMFIHFTSKFVEILSRLTRITIVANAAQSKKTLALKNGKERASSSVLESPHLIIARNRSYHVFCKCFYSFQILRQFL